MALPVMITAALLAVYLAGLFDTMSTHRLVPAWIVAGCLTAGMMVYFAMEFPYRLTLAQQFPAWRWAPLIVAVAASGAALSFYQASDPALERGMSLVVQTSVAAGLVLLAGNMLWRRSHSASPVARNQSTIVLISLLPWLVVALVNLGWLLIEGHPFDNLLVFNQVLPCCSR